METAFFALGIILWVIIAVGFACDLISLAIVLRGPPDTGPSPIPVVGFLAYITGCVPSLCGDEPILNITLAVFISLIAFHLIVHFVLPALLGRLSRRNPDPPGC